ncbi:MAG: protein phosphatase 2C domain-containing protein [Chloroflexota bacterium]|nr:protein phosphatase 2C domain-containing protein [Chloroflexota bacterium]
MNIFNLSRLFSTSRNKIVDGLASKHRIQIGRAAQHPPISGRPSITLSHSQSVGLVREDNEDSLFALTGMNAGDSEQNNFGLFVVADGMGGHQQGERASTIAAQSVAKVVGNYIFSKMLEEIQESCDNKKLMDLMRSALIAANDDVTNRVPGGGTTLTALLLIGSNAIVGHVGDSRAYMVDSGKLLQLTKDHSLVQKLYDLGEIASTGIENHPRRNILLRAVGQSDILEVDVFEQYVEPGSIFLLCTDGLWGCVEEEDILTIMMDSSDLQEACDNLTKEANKAGGLDNITSLIVKYDYGNSK